MTPLSRLLILTTLAASLLAVGGCRSRCERLCDRTVVCLPGEVSDLIPDFMGIECRWDHGAKAADARCLTACRSEYEELAHGVAEQVNKCLDCRLEAGRDIGEGCANYGTMGRVCETPCDPSGVEAFWDRFQSEADLVSDLACD